ncbi:T9SS type A sorting domain-containing protein [Vaginella massiliensis]|uniref:T9SS type A sorting domain-containing protein n=1 Tax=Vaginella massiliensis TaxID=1816680 RepID=UPI0008387A16|nr:T9SS type A sorting domain-containing protein [Vaginella massiliensis]
MKKIFTSLSFLALGTLVFGQNLQDEATILNQEAVIFNKETLVNCNVENPQSVLASGYNGIIGEQKLAADLKVAEATELSISSIAFNFISFDSDNTFINSVSIEVYESVFDQESNLLVPGNLIQRINDVPVSSHTIRGYINADSGRANVRNYVFNLSTPLVISSDVEKTYWIAFTDAKLSATPQISTYMGTTNIINSEHSDLTLDLVTNKWKKIQNNAGTPFDLVLKITANCENLGIEDFQQYKTSIYPNPVNDQLAVEGKNVENIEVYNIVGQKMKLKSEKVSAQKSIIDVKSLEAGVYILKANINGSVETLKFIKK